MKIKRKKGFFSISAVSKMFSVHQQTIRLYEKEGLLNPKRSEGNTRLFAEEDIDRLEEIIYLTHELGINLAGVEMILKLKKQIKKMQRDMNALFEETQKELDLDEKDAKKIIQTSAQKLNAMKPQNFQLPQENIAQMPQPKQQFEQQQLKIESDDYWKVEYEE